MNFHLMTQIIYHVVANLGMMPSVFTDQLAAKNILDPSFLLKEKLSFNIEGSNINYQVYGCQISTSDGKNIKILASNCSENNKLEEFYILVNLQDAPAYGIYYNHDVGASNNENMIAVTVDNKNWMFCNTYLQATFLAGMERLRDLGLNWTNCTSYNEEYIKLLSFIDFHSSVYDDENEG